jgi:uncharacterized protein
VTRWRFILFVVMSVGSIAPAAEVIPSVPTRHFNDYAGVVSAATEQRLDRKLEDFEKTSSNQILVVVYPRMQSDSSIEDYTVRVAQKWGVGQKDRKNGVVLFVFSNDRRMFIQVGYGLEGALPDITAGQIIENEIKPRFRSGDFDGGLTAGVDAIIAATKGEYTAKPRNQGGQTAWIWPVLIVVLIILMRMKSRGGPTIYGRRGRMGPIFIPGGGWGGGRWGGGGGWGGGGSGGGGGFSAGGGSFGGGGAGGSW